MFDGEENPFGQGEGIAAMGAGDGWWPAGADAIDEMLKFRGQLIAMLTVDRDGFEMAREQFLAEPAARRRTPGRLRRQRFRLALFERFTNAGHRYRRSVRLQADQ